jgi:deazaflavin-dependent oxidoreductase (nitroreductase family)
MDTDWFARVADADFCYLTTIGRVSGWPHMIEIWFAVYGDAIYMLSGNLHRSDWVRNIVKEPRVEVRFGRPDAEPHAGRGRVVDAQAEPELDAAVRRVVATKYDEWEDGPGGKRLSGWARTALPVEVRFDG